MHTSINIVSKQLSGSNYWYLTLIILFIKLFVCTQSNDSNYCYVIPIFQFRYTVKEFHVLFFNTNNSIQNYSFVCTQLNGSKYCYVSLTIQLNISQLIYTQLNYQTVLFLTIQFSISHLLAHSLNVKQFYLTHREDPIRCYHSRPEWTCEQWQ